MNRHLADRGQHLQLLQAPFRLSSIAFLCVSATIINLSSKDRLEMSDEEMAFHASAPKGVLTYLTAPEMSAPTW